MTFCTLQSRQRSARSAGFGLYGAIGCVMLVAACGSDDTGIATTGVLGSGSGGSSGTGVGVSAAGGGGGSRSSSAGTSASGASGTSASIGTSGSGGRAGSGGAGATAAAGTSAAAAGSGGRAAAGSGGGGGTATAGSAGIAAAGNGAAAGSGGEIAAGAGGRSAGAGGAAGGSGAAGEDDDAGVPPEPGDSGTPAEDPGKGDGLDVVTLGDSWMSYAVGIGTEYSLVNASGQPYRTYALNGSELLSGAVAAQYALAKQEDPDIKTVVMSAGADDLFRVDRQQSCADGGNACAQVLTDVSGQLAELWGQMAADGVKDVVHVLYSSDAGGGLGDFDSNKQRLQELCDAVPAPLRCHLVTTDDLVMGELRIDGVHPSNAAYNRIGGALYTLMVMEGMSR